MQRLKKIIFVFLAIFFLPIDLQAQNISIEAFVNSDRIMLGSSLKLTLTVTGTKDVGPIDLPSIAGMEARYLGPSTRISIVNGKFSSSVAHIYTLIPLRVGKFQIPSISITLSGKSYTTDPVDIEVVDQGALRGTQQHKASSQPLSLKDKVFLTTEIPKTQLYLNEKSSLTFKLYISGVSLRDIQYPDFKHTGFTIDQFQKPKQYRENIGGTVYDVVEFKTFIYPTRTGKLSIGSTKLKSNVLIRSTERRRKFGFGSFDSFFDDDFLGGVFDRYQKHPIAVESNDTIINVLPLPKEGKPVNFSGAVGRFDFEASVNPAEVKVGDPVTLKMKIQGDGNLKSAAMPSLEPGSNFKLYDPQIKVEGGAKTLEQVVIARTDKVTQIPAIGFSYFDVKAKRYKTITRGPFSLRVIKPDKLEQFEIIEFADEKKAVVKEKLGRDIVFIKDRPGDFRKINSDLYRSSGFVTLVILSFLIWLSALVGYRRTHKLRTDVGYARRLRALRQAKKELNEARRFLEQQQQKEFYNSIFRTLQEYFGNKFHLSSGAVTIETVNNKLNSYKIETELLKSIKSLFAECDLIRYASVDTDENKMRDNYKKTEEIIDYLEKHVK